MGEGFGQLIFVLLIMAAAAFDAIGRNRKKKERMEEMEREESEGGASTVTRDRTRREGTPGGEGQAPRAERETADTMIPEDFWAILTGQAPVETEPEPEVQEMEEEAWRQEGRRQAEVRGKEAPSREGAGAEEYRGPGSAQDWRGPRAPQDPPRRPHIPTPVPSDRYVDPEELAPAEVQPDSAREVEPPATRRGSRWMEGLEARSPTEGDAIQAQEAAVYGSLDEPWGELEDIAAGEIDEDARIYDGIGAGADDRAPGRRRRRGTGASPYTRFLESGDREDLRKAIVLREVLGSPAGFRTIGHEWGDDR